MCLSTPRPIASEWYRKRYRTARASPLGSVRVEIGAVRDHPALEALRPLGLAAVRARVVRWGGTSAHRGGNENAREK